MNINTFHESYIFVLLVMKLQNLSIGCDLLYIDEDWTDEIKRGVPGTESLIHVKNPLQIFGDLELRYAINSKK